MTSKASPIQLISGEINPCSPAEHHVIDKSVYRERVKMIFDNGVSNAAYVQIGTLLISFFLYAAGAKQSSLIAFVSISLLLGLIMIFYHHAFYKAAPPYEKIQSWLAGRLALGICFGLLWGFSSYLLPRGVAFYHEFSILFVLVTMIFICNIGFSVIPAFYLTVTLAILGPSIIYYLMMGGTVHIATAVVCVFWSLFVSNKSLQVSKVTVKTVYLNQLLKNEMKQHKEARKMLHEMATHDSLTGLANRRLFLLQLEDLIKRSNRYQEKLAVMFIDLDGFKAVNDTFGHECGDQLLQEVASRLQNQIRDTDKLARIGGDEFIIACSIVQDNHDRIVQVSQRVINAMAAPFELKGGRVGQIGCSIGVALYPDHGKIAEELMTKADKAMYDVKAQGKNNFLIL